MDLEQQAIRSFVEDYGEDARFFILRDPCVTRVFGTRNKAWDDAWISDELGRKYGGTVVRFYPEVA